MQCPKVGTTTKKTYIFYWYCSLHLVYLLVVEFFGKQVSEVYPNSSIFFKAKIFYCPFFGFEMNEFFFEYVS